MSNLAESDYRAILEVLRAAGEVSEPTPFPESLLESLRRLVPCDVVAYHERIDGERAIAWTGEPRGPMTPEIRAASKRCSGQCPLTPSEAPRMYSDHFSSREFHRLELYQDVARPLGIEDMIRLWLDPNGVDEARLEFDRGRRTFTERDRSVLDLIRPHLEQLRRRARRRRVAATLSSKAARLTMREREVLALVADGRTNAEVARLLWISPQTVRTHLANVFEKLEVHTRTAAAAAMRDS